MYHLVAQFTVLTVFSESVECSDERIYCLSLLLRPSIKTCMLIDGISLLDKVLGEPLLDDVEVSSIFLVQSEASKNVLHSSPIA